MKKGKIMAMFRKRRQDAKPKITIEELAKVAGVAPLTIQKIETGRIDNPGVKTVSAIEEALTLLEGFRNTG